MFGHMLFLGVLYACALYFCICACSARLSMFHTGRRSRNTLIVIVINSSIIIIIIIINIIIIIIVVVIVVVVVVVVVIIIERCCSTKRQNVAIRKQETAGELPVSDVSVCCCQEFSSHCYCCLKITPSAVMEPGSRCSL